MLTLPRSVRVFVASTPIDMRRGHDALVQLVRDDWKLDPFSGHIFGFLSRRLDRAKLLYWDRGGLVLLYKRLDHGRFKLPEITPGRARLEIDGSQLGMLLDGVDLRLVKLPKTWIPPSSNKTIDTDTDF